MSDNHYSKEDAPVLPPSTISQTLLRNGLTPEDLAFMQDEVEAGIAAPPLKPASLALAGVGVGRNRDGQTYRRVKGSDSYMEGKLGSKFKRGIIDISEYRLGGVGVAFSDATPPLTRWPGLAPPEMVTEVTRKLTPVERGFLCAFGLFSVLKNEMGSSDAERIASAIAEGIKDSVATPWRDSSRVWDEDERAGRFAADFPPTSLNLLALGQHGWRGPVPASRQESLAWVYTAWNVSVGIPSELSDYRGVEQQKCLRVGAALPTGDRPYFFNLNGNLAVGSWLFASFIAQLLQPAIKAKLIALTVEG